MDADYQNVLVGINGFGVIGRIVYRQLQRLGNIKVARINDLFAREDLEYLLRNDSSHGRNKLSLDEVELTQEKDAAKLNWKDIDVVIDSTPHLRSYEQLSSHLNNGASYVLRTSPLKGNLDNAQTIIMGVNDKDFDLDKYQIFSLASCTTNCLAPLVKVVRDYCQSTGNEIENMDFVTVHAYTSDQLLKDGPHKSDPRRGRDVHNILETETGASSQIKLIFPELDGKIHGSAYRVPVPDGSALELRIIAKKEINLKELNLLFQRASQKELKKVISYNTEPLVSGDCLNDPHSCIYSEKAGEQFTPRKIKLGAFYDNEFGYSNRVVDLISRIKKERFEPLRQKFSGYAQEMTISTSMNNCDKDHNPDCDCQISLNESEINAVLENVSIIPGWKSMRTAASEYHILTPFGEYVTRIKEEGLTLYGPDGRLLDLSKNKETHQQVRDTLGYRVGVSLRSHLPADLPSDLPVG